MHCYTLRREMFLQVGGHVSVQECRHHHRQHLHDANAQSTGRQRFRYFQADQSGAHNHRALTSIGDGCADAFGIIGMIQAKDVLQVRTGNGGQHGVGAGSQYQFVVGDG
ncbi:MAG: hypothetical protein BWY76_02662 [bacterium ADurb.Bin429]|nr:MAG: hypothetical protein BWY76_02662 [bacterium ADurb.Bin429]